MTTERMGADGGGSEERPALFGLPPGVDFADALARGLLERHGDGPPEALARVSVIVAGRRLQRRLREALAARGPLLLPRIRTVEDVAADTPLLGLPPAAPKLRRRLEVAQLVARLIEREPDLAPRGALYDLADSLASLMEEMHDEDVTPEDVAAVDVGALSAHWERSLRFVRIVRDFFEAGHAPDGEARLRAVVAHYTRDWGRRPPDHPIVVAGSTGSRGATALLMRRVARAPGGAVVFPGFDFDLPGSVWCAMDDPLTHEDHPQYRFRRLFDELDTSHRSVRPWCGAAAPAPARNRLVSMALRPAPVTDGWRRDGPALGDLRPAAEGLTLLEAPTERAEALAIALRLRRAAEDGARAALVTPDRQLARRVTAALDRWGIVPDDSAGMPLHLSPPGRLLRQIARLHSGRVTIEALLSLLKHPLVHSGADRGEHLTRTRRLELSLRRDGPPYPLGPDLLTFADGCADDPWCARWAAWLAPLLDLVGGGDRPLTDHVRRHLDLAGRLARGSVAPVGTGGLWEEAAGEEALRVMGELAREAAHGGTMSCIDYAKLLDRILSTEEVRRPEVARPDILIWGLQEVRVGGLDLAILGGLNDTVWPERPAADPWMNREMRRQAGLRLPELAVGLSAHAFQQAAGAPEVWLTRARRDAEAETVPSRWVNRLTTLMGGLPETHGPQALAAMRERGAAWLALAAALDRPEAPRPPEPRPSPAPPPDMRPRRYSVSRVKELLRDPYAVYASEILRLRKLAPLRPEPDAALRGQVVHAALERFGRRPLSGDRAADRARLMACLEAELEAQAPWPAARRLWLARLGRVADWFLDREAERRARSTPVAWEAKGELPLPEVAPDVVLTARADRIDRGPEGVILYDYKTGTPPSPPRQVHFDRQLLLEAMMAERGAFEAVGPSPVEAAIYIGLGTEPKEVQAPLGDVPPEEVHRELGVLLSGWMGAARGYTARRAMEEDRHGSDYDHLSRLGEWEVTDTPERIVLP
jgi:double-strand break repair protein AddB